MDGEIIIVSGLPRSGTSLMMQMLEKGGVRIVTDHARAADVDNPRGYYEFERVKAIRRDASWLRAARGAAVKMVSRLLYDLPPTERYRIVFMERDMDETLRSQEAMLNRLGRAAAPREVMRRSYAVHLQRLHEWLGRQPHMEVLQVGYNTLLAHPEAEVERVCHFLDGGLDVEGMASAVDRSLYRNRSALCGEGSSSRSSSGIPGGDSA